jgi:NDP-4-keto-2,6-dideoxyhexose 3-C-methyltransferase
VSFTTRTTCRVCPNHAPLTPVLDLGYLVISTFVAPDATAPPPAAPLRLGVCHACSLVQLMETVPFDQLFRHYWYKSGINETMVKELTQVVFEGIQRVNVQPMDYVLDIGANDGTLLSAYRTLCGSRVPQRIGFEPAYNLTETLRPHTELCITEAFPPRNDASLQAYCPDGIKIITAVAMAYDLEDPNRFAHGVKELLHQDGVCILQFQDLVSMLEMHAFDNICHEHLEYYTLRSVQKWLAHNDLVVYEVQRTAINGGSLRLFIGHKHPVPHWAEHTNTDSVLAELDREDEAGLLDIDTIGLAFSRLQQSIERGTAQVQATIEMARDQGHVVDGYGASTKGNTLLQVFGLDSTHIRQIAERSPDKDGLVTAGSRIPIVSEKTWRDAPAPVTLVPIWQFRKHVLKREKQYLEKGGEFLFPLPQVTGVRK